MHQAYQEDEDAYFVNEKGKEIEEEVWRGSQTSAAMHRSAACRTEDVDIAIVQRRGDRDCGAVGATRTRDGLQLRP